MYGVSRTPTVHGTAPGLGAGRSASSEPRTPFRVALQPSQHGRSRIEITGLKVFSTKTSKSKIVNPRDPWHPSVPHCDPRSTAAACPRSRSYPGSGHGTGRCVPVNDGAFSSLQGPAVRIGAPRSRRRSVDDRRPRDPCAALRPLQSGRAAETPKKKSSLRYSSKKGHRRRHQAKGALVPRLFRPRHQLGGADTNWDGGKPITDNHRWTQGDDQVKAGLHSAIPLYPPPPHFHADTHATDKREGINL